MYLYDLSRSASRSLVGLSAPTRPGSATLSAAEASAARRPSRARSFSSPKQQVAIQSEKATVPTTARGQTLQ